jgi:hypothetical protein
MLRAAQSVGGVGSAALDAVSTKDEAVRLILGQRATAVDAILEALGHPEVRRTDDTSASFSGRPSKAGGGGQHTELSDEIEFMTSENEELRRQLDVESDDDY